MFNGCESFNNSGAQLPIWTPLTLIRTFKGCKEFVPVSNIPFNTTSVTSLLETFRGCEKFDLDKVSQWNTSNVSVFESCFQDCSTAKSSSFPTNWDISNATSLNKMFNKCSIDNDFSAWDFTTLGLNATNALSVTYNSIYDTVIVYADGTESLANMTSFPPFPYADFWADGANLEIDGWMKDFVSGSTLSVSNYDSFLAKLANELPDLNIADAASTHEVAQINNTGLSGNYYGKIGMGVNTRSNSSNTAVETINEKGWYLIDGGLV
jgi:surface protein